MFPLLFSLILAGIGPASAQDGEAEEAPTKVVKVPDLPLEIELPSPDGEAPPFINSAVLQGDMLLEISRLDDSVQVVFGLDQTFQPFLDKGAPTAPPLILVESMEIEDYAIPTEWETSLSEHPTVGTLWTAVGSTEIPPPPPQYYADGTLIESDAPTEPTPLTVQLGVFAVEFGYVGFVAIGLDAEALAADVTQLLDWTTVTAKPKPLSEFTVGPAVSTMKAGWSVTVPEGWRALSDKEVKGLAPSSVGGDTEFGGARSHAMFVDTTDFTGERHFTCSALSYPEKPTEVVDPERSPDHGNRYKIFSKLRLRGGKYKNARGEEMGLDRVDDLTSPLPVKIEPGAEGTLGMVNLPDRDGYLWRIQGTRGDEAMEVATFATAWEEIGLDCNMVVRPENVADLQIFEKAMATVTVTDGERHPHVLGARGWYRKHWPFTHPALQVWWIVAILLAGGIFLAFRSED